jgi:hypothetical protein
MKLVNEIENKLTLLKSMYIVLKITVHSKKSRETVLQTALCQIVIKSSTQLGSIHLLNSVSVSDLHSIVCTAACVHVNTLYLLNSVYPYICANVSAIISYLSTVLLVSTAVHF